KTGGLADVVGSLPQALRQLQQQQAAHQVTVIMPFYRQHLQQAGIATQALDLTIDMWADGVQRLCPIHEAKVDGLRFLLVEQDDLYARDELYGTPDGAYEDNLLRYVLFNRVALEVAAQLEQAVDVIHCHDWQTGMVPLLLKTQYQHYPKIAHAKTVYTIHNLAYQGVFAETWMGSLGIPTHHFHGDGFEFYNQINCMKAGILMADAITTVSPTYAEEILTPEFGCHIEGFLAQHQHKLTGIVNGLDIEQWNPQTDHAITHHFAAGKVSNKKKCKQALQTQCGFEVDPKTPLLTLISRLAEQKGIDLLLENIPTWLDRGYQLVILGSGDANTEQQLQTLADKHPQHMHFYCGFNEAFARQVYAGGDIFLMPSRFEPCGLGQLMAMRYGNVPVVRATGGLKDTVIDYQQNKSKATGFHFEAATAHAFDQALEAAIEVYKTPRTWSRVRGNALKRASSWQTSAQVYIDLYQDLIKPETDA
ncbi:MAG: glycogen synthase GlgA, partial [Mariprofundaceae bacterium]|nr:glycogen synthase GlgA [Mariprofundaceae bacterium]